MSRFAEDQDPLFRRINSSISFDRRLAPFDVEQSRAHVRALGRLGVLDEAEVTTLLEGLDSVAAELEGGGFEFSEQDEDIHMAIERRLTELVGPVGGKLHTARARNDQVVSGPGQFRPTPDVAVGGGGVVGPYLKPPPSGIVVGPGTAGVGAGYGAAPPGGVVITPGPAGAGAQYRPVPEEPQPHLGTVPRPVPRQ